MPGKHSTAPAFRKPAICACTAADLRFERDIAALHRLGPRAVAEAFRHLGATSFRMTEIEQVVARYAGLDPALVRAFGADRFPPYPDLRLVKGRHD